MNLACMGLACMNAAAVAPLGTALPATFATVDPGGLVWTEIDPGRTVGVAADAFAGWGRILTTAVPVDAFAALDPHHTIGD